MRANQRKLLGIIGALVVPIALVVGLYADSGDLFKGYLTFDQTSAGPGSSQVETFLFGDSSDGVGVINGALDSSGDLSGVFVDYFNGTTTDQSESPVSLFDATTQCEATDMTASTASYDMKNLSDQYAILTDLLKDRGDAANVGHFNHFIDFYANRGTTHNAGAAITTGLESKLDSTNIGGKISYEDIQKMLLLNFQAYQAANCANNGGAISAYHDGSSYTNLTSEDGLRTLFEGNLAHKERLFSQIKYDTTEYNDVSTNRIVAMTGFLDEGERADFNPETGIPQDLITLSDYRTIYESLNKLSNDLLACINNSTSWDSSNPLELGIASNILFSDTRAFLADLVAPSFYVPELVDFLNAQDDNTNPKTLAVTQTVDSCSKAQKLVEYTLDELEQVLDVTFDYYESSNLDVDLRALLEANGIPEEISIKTDIKDPKLEASLVEITGDFNRHELIQNIYRYSSEINSEITSNTGAIDITVLSGQDPKSLLPVYYNAAEINSTRSLSDPISLSMASTDSHTGINATEKNPDKNHALVITLSTDSSDSYKHNFISPVTDTNSETWNQNEKQVYIYLFRDNTFRASNLNTSTSEERNIVTDISQTEDVLSITTSITLPEESSQQLPQEGYELSVVSSESSIASSVFSMFTAQALTQDEANTKCTASTEDAVDGTFDSATNNITADLDLPSGAGTYYVCQLIHGEATAVATFQVDSDGEVVFIQQGASDTDEDGLTDLNEALLGTDPTDADADLDSDGIPDAVEFFNGLDPNNDEDANEDADSDGLTNADEFTAGTDINNEDSDDDGMKDGFEVDNGLNPNDSSDAANDEDGDELTNLQEFEAGTDPNDSDSDDDGVSDKDDETPITATDTDSDGVADTNDNCPDTPNPDQADADNDGTGDVCDDRPNGEPELDSSIETEVTTGTTVILTIKGDNLVDEKTSGNTYKLKTSTGTLVAEAEQVVSDSDGNITISFGAVLPCMESTCAAYELHMVDSVGEVNLGLKVSIAKFNVLSPQNGVSLTRPGITFQCLESDEYTYQVTLKQGSTVVETVSDIDCLGDQATANLTNDLTAGATYSVIVAVKDGIGDTVGSNYQAHSFTTSNTFLLSGEQMQSLTYSCGQQRPETTDANGVIIPGTSNVVIAGQTANCAISNPFTNATINSNYKIKFGESTPDTNAVQIQSVSTGFSALNIPVPTNTADNKIVLFVPNSSGANEKFTASSTLTIEASNGGSGTEVTGADLTDLVEIDIDNDIEIGEEIDMEVFIPEGLNVHFLQVAFEGNEDDRDTEDEKGMIFRYCQEDITDLLETRDQRDTMEDLCEDFSDDDILEGPLEVEIENFDTSRISVEGDYDIVIDMFLEGEAEQTAKSNTAYAQDVQLLQTRIRIENAFEAEDNEFDAGRGGWGSIGFPGFNPGVIVGSVQQCGQIFVDLRGGHQICQDIMYLYDKNLYRGIQMGPNIVSGISQPAVRAHIFAFVAQVLNTYRNAPRMVPDLYALSQYYSDLPFEVISNPQQQWWVAPLYTLSAYNYVTGDSQYRARPFDPITQAQAAKLIGMATGLIPGQLAQMNPWYAQIVSQYLTYGLNLNPDAPATMGDILILLSRSMQIMENPSLYSVQNPYMGASGYQSNGYNTQFVQGGYGTQYYSQAGYGQGYGQPYGQTQGYFY